MPRPVRVAVAVTVCLLMAAALGAGVVLGGDGGTTVFGTEPEVVEAQPGEEVTVNLTINTQGDLLGNGLNAYEFSLLYHPERLDVVEVEHGDYLAVDDFEVDTTDEHEPGELFIEHTIEDRESGVRGGGVIATVRFQVAENASPADLQLGYADATGTYIGGHVITPFRWNGTIAVDGGGPQLTYHDWASEETGANDDAGTADDPEAADDADDGSGVIRADEVDRELDPDDTEDDTGIDTDEAGGSDRNDADDGTGDDGDPMPGFGAAALLGVLLALGLRRFV